MDERKFRILQAIIDDYILTAIPVGSRTLSKKYEMGLSSATIRNEMSDLEELGYLDQPHVSAGRVPSNKAYRLYVDQLLERGAIPNSETQSVLHYFDRRAVQMEDVISEAAKVISGLTHYTAVVMSPKNSELLIRNLQLVPVSTQSALLVIVTDAGIMRDSVISIGSDLDSDALYAISRSLTELVAGKTISQAQRLLADLLNRDVYGGVLENISNFLQDVSNDVNKRRIALEGPSNILSFPEYSDVEKARGFLSVLEAKDQLLQLLDNHGEMAFTVRIGPENGIPELSDCSLVTATYRLNDNSYGTLGVIGPVRMQYGHVLSILGAMGRELSSLLEQERSGDAYGKQKKK